MNHYTTGRVKFLDFPFQPSPSGPFMQLYAQEERRNAYVSDGPLWDRPRRHFFGGKDSSAQFLAQEVALDVFVEESIRAASEEARAEALRRLDSYPER